MTIEETKPLVSICIPVYGVEKFIEKCARSLFEQTYSNIEYIFVNDCTKDNSIAVLRQVMEDYPLLKDRIHIVEHSQNKGLAGARNTAIEYAHGEFVMWVDSDDYIDVKTITLLVEKQIEKDADIVISDAYRCYPSFREYVSLKPEFNNKHYLHKVLRDETEHWLAGKLLRRKLYTEHNIRAREGANMGEDFQVYPQLVFYANKIDYVEEPLYYYMFHNTNSYGHTVSEDIQSQRWLSYEVLENFFANSEYADDLNYQKLQIVYFQFKTYLMNEGLSIDHYRMLWKRLNQVPDKIYASYPLFKRVLLHVLKSARSQNKLGCCNKHVLRSYVFIINAANNSIRYIKSHFR